ncbi:hypothetical protein EVC29_002 [Rhizobium phage RHph_Y52]|nr:hypothetical protein EVC16_002 [Rhizobium phage RHph_Y21]QIG76704.1 hypothetical protein EVC29_002 [Rhizobium phage RHph_Y52]
MTRIYFAHAVTDYNTDRESTALAVIRARWPGSTIVNPNASIHEHGYRRDGMVYFKSLVEGCAMLVFMRFPNGAIGAGVGKEIQWASDKGLLIREVFGNETFDVRGKPTPVLSVEQTRAMIRTITAGKFCTKK